MPYSVSSWFQQQAEKKISAPVRKFTMAGSDYSDRVLAWPSFGVSWNDIKPIRVTLGLGNEDKALNFMRTDKTNLQNSCSLQMGFTRFGEAVVTDSSGSIMVDSSADMLSYASSDCTFEITAQVNSMIGSGTTNLLFCRDQKYTGLVINPLNGKVLMRSRDNVGNSDIVTWNTSLTLGQQYHFTGIQNVSSQYVALAVDGVMVDSIAMSANPRTTSTARTFIMANSQYNVFGACRDARLYSRAISPSEYASHAAAVYSDNSNLLTHISFDDGIGDDDSGNGLNTTIAGSVDLNETAVANRFGPGTPELITLFNGTIDSFDMIDGMIRLTMADKFRQLSERVIGTSNSAQDYTSSNYLASDLAWYICTSHGGLDATQSSSNVDIDYDSFQTWAAVMSGDTVLMQARYAGTRVLEALRKMSNSTFTAIYQEQDKIKFHRFGVADSHSTSLDKNNFLGNELSVDGKEITNRKLVMLDYDVTSRYHKSTVTVEDSASVNSFGLREAIEKDASLWYVNSQSALNAAQRSILVHKVPFDHVVTKAPLVGMLRSVGEMLSISDGQIGMTSETFRIMKRSISMNDGTVTFNADASQILGGFTLDVSSLDGVDALI